MNTDQYWAIAERDIEIQNPVTDRKLRLLDDYCDIRDGLKVLDVGCGKAWLMRGWAERYAIDGTGLETNPAFLKFARSKSPAKGQVNFIAGPALDFKPDPDSYDVILCLGAAFALGGLVAAVDWMIAAVKPGGRIVVGDLTLRHKPTVATGQVLPQDAIDTIGIIERHGAEVSALISASDADFERYISHHRHATLTWARENPQHPDHAEALAKSRGEWTHYLKTIRPLLGWTVFVGRRSDG